MFNKDVILHPALPVNARPCVRGRGRVGRKRARQRKLTFQDELRLWLKRYELVYDERYVWD
jgi:hypothetical protein